MKLPPSSPPDTPETRVWVRLAYLGWTLEHLTTHMRATLGSGGAFRGRDWDTVAHALGVPVAALTPGGPWIDLVSGEVAFAAVRRRACVPLRREVIYV